MQSRCSMRTLLRPGSWQMPTGQTGSNTSRLTPQTVPWQPSTSSESSIRERQPLSSRRRSAIVVISHLIKASKTFVGTNLCRSGQTRPHRGGLPYGLGARADQHIDWCAAGAVPMVRRTLRRPNQSCTVPMANVRSKKAEVMIWTLPGRCGALCRVQYILH